MKEGKSRQRSYWESSLRVDGPMKQNEMGRKEYDRMISTILI